MTEGPLRSDAQKSFEALLVGEQLATGEYEESPHIARWLASCRFLRAVRTHYPQVLHTLRRCPYPPESKTGLAFLRSWARDYHLAADWVLRFAAETVHAWHTRPPADHAGLYWAVLTLPLSEILSAAKGYPAALLGDPQHETPEAFFRRAGEHWRACCDFLDGTGPDGKPLARRMRRKQQRARADSARHYDWLARHVVGELNTGDIAKTSGVHRQTVDQAIQKLAALIHLPLPEGKRGPKRKIHRSPKILR